MDLVYILLIHAMEFDKIETETQDKQIPNLLYMYSQYNTIVLCIMYILKEHVS